MCVAYPARVLAVRAGGSALVWLRGREQPVLLLAMAQAPEVGDWLLVQSGIALARIDAGEAAERARLLDEISGRSP
jgi:hydrogenase assembly chaperone HypC/HupF